jgi:hypothetical protein
VDETMMVASSRSSSLRTSVRPPPQQQPHQNGGGGAIEEDISSISKNDKTANMHATKTATITTSKSLPNLKNNKTSSSPPPPPNPPRRSQINNNTHHHRIGQTTLDSFLKRDTHVSAENDEQQQPPAKKARRMNNNNNTDKFNYNNNITIAPPKQPLQSRNSPDPLNIITTKTPDSLRARARANTFNTATTSPTRSTTTTTRSTRHGEQKPVIIANDDDRTDPDDHPSLGGGEGGEQKKAPEKRSLRSHDGGSRSKSELAMYFPSYEQIISLEPVKPEFLAPETMVALMDDLTESPLPPPSFSSSLDSSSPSRTRKQRKSIDQISPFGNPLLELHQVEKVELAQVDNEHDDDPLSDDIYFKAHRRHERQEKQLRNIEKERAQHEKIQLDRLLDELQGHDWLRVMGISGITDTEKKLYEPKRDHFVREVTALIDKFRIWKEEEKRRKMEREQTALEAAATEQEEEEEEEEEEGEEEEEEEAQPSSDNQSYGTPPDPNDVDAWAARQLLQEARSASSINGHAGPRRRLVDELTGSPPNSHKQSQRTTQKPLPPTPTPQKQREPSEELEPKPFVSFYPKRHLRDAALSGRRGGRNRSAFGQPLPDIEEREFRLPSYILTDDVIHATERKRRRLKRESRG